MLKKIVKSIVTSSVGKAIIETLIFDFLQWMEKQGYDIRWKGGREVMTTDTLRDKISLFTKTKI